MRYRATDQTGKRVQRQHDLGTTAELKTESQVRRAAEVYRQQINNRAPATQLTTVGGLAQHFKEKELREDDDRRSWSTKQNYRDVIDGCILPHWENTRLMDVKSVAIEEWLPKLRCKRSGKPLSNPTRQRIRNVFSVLFTHAQRHELVPIGHNPVKLVRQSGKRSRIPDILEPWEINLLWTNSEKRERAAISLQYGNGFRISEPFALRWSDIDFDNGTAAVTKAIVKGHLGDTKTEVSKKLVPLHADQLADLKQWRAVAPYPEDNSWVFGSHRANGSLPYWPDMILKRKIQPLAKGLGISKRIGWHTFRRTYATLLKANGEDVKTVQELCRHANPSTTLMLYVQAIPETVRAAQGKVVEMVRRAPLRPPEARKV